MSKKLGDVKPTHKLTREMVNEFCWMAYRAHDIWKVFTILFGKESEVEVLKKSRSPYFFGLLCEIFYRQSLLEIIKLHDPAEQSKRKNLTIDYIMRNGKWDRKTQAELRLYVKKMNVVVWRLKKVRNRILTHHDLATILRNRPLGPIRPGMLETYFENLEKFVSLSKQRVVKEPFFFGNAMLFNDARALLNVVLEDTKEWKKKGWGEEITW